MKTILQSVFLVLITFSSYAQNWQEGYVITSENEKIEGEVQSQSQSATYKKCVFRTNGKKIVYTPQDIKGYGLSNGLYYSSEFIPGNFVEVIVEGDLDLFTYDGFFYLRKDSTELTKLRQLTTTDKGLTQTNSQWKGILNYLTSDCSMNNNLKKVRYKRSSISKYVINYNKCKNAIYQVHRSSKKVELSVLLGYNIQAVDLKPSESPNYPYPKKELVFNSPTIGIGLEVDIAPIKGLKAHSNLLYQKFEKSYSYERTISRPFVIDYFYNNEVTLRGSSLEIPIYVSYAIINRDLILRALIGFNPAFQFGTEAPIASTYTNNMNDDIRYLSGDLLVEHVIGYPQLKTFQYSAFSGISLQGRSILKRFSLEYRYFLSSKLSAGGPYMRGSDLQPRVNRSSILIKYDLGK